MSPSVTRYPSIDYLRVILAGCVVFAHSVLMTGYQFRWMSEVGYGVLRLVVPAFALVSGFGLYHTAMRGRLSGWLRGLVVLYAIWTLIYLPVWGRMVAETGGWMSQIINGPMHLWYIASLIQIVAILWLLRRVVPSSWEIAAMATMAVVSAVTATLAQYNNHFGFLGPDFVLPRASALYLLPFVVQGYLVAHWLGRRGRTMLPRASVLWLLVVILLILRMLEVRWLTAAGAVPMKDPPEFPVLLYLAPLALVLAVIRIDLPEVRINLTSASVLIYLMHMGIIIAFVTVGFTQMWPVFATAFLLPLAITVALPHLPPVGRLGGRWASRTSASRN